MMPRRSLTAKQREELWNAEAAKALRDGRGTFPICRLCDLPVFPGQRWHDNHDRHLPRAIGGERDGLSHERCNIMHARTHDVPLIAKAKRIRRKHIGAFQTRTQMRFGRYDKLKKKMDGTVVLRSTEEPYLYRRKS